MSQAYSIAIETSCRAGAVALGRGDELLATRALGATGRHAADLLPTVRDLLTEHGATPADVGQLYASVGPGSFTGICVGLTVARTWAQIQPSLKLVAVPTAQAVALGAPVGGPEHVGVLLAAKERTVHATLVRRSADACEAVGEPRLAEPAELLAAWPRPILLTGEALNFLDLAEADGVSLAPPEVRLPRAENVWRVGRQLATAGRFVELAQLLPVYARRPEAVRLWEKLHGPDKPAL